MDQSSKTIIKQANTYLQEVFTEVENLTPNDIYVKIDKIMSEFRIRLSRAYWLSEDDAKAWIKEELLYIQYFKFK